MPSPMRIFRRLSSEQIQELIDSGFERILNGDYSAMSGAGKSFSKTHMDVEKLMFEANYELDLRAGTGRKSKVYQDFSRA